MVERITALGHQNITSNHRTTIEITKEEELTKRGDCIIGVGADKGIKDLREEFKKKARNPKAIIEVKLNIIGMKETITGKGHPDLTFTHPTDMVIRKSDFICGRTLMIKADKSSKDLKRDIVEKLKDPKQKIDVLIHVK
jgi:hypothetical protein